MLKDMMDELVEFARTNWDAEIDHYYLCKAVCDRYNLYEDECFPTWLSRVVAGVMTDMENDE